MRINEDYLDFLEVLDEDYNGNAETMTARIYALEQKDALQDERISAIEKKISDI